MCMSLFICKYIWASELDSLESYESIISCLHLFSICTKYVRDKVWGAILYVSMYVYISCMNVSCVDGATYTSPRSVNHWQTSSRLSSVLFGHPVVALGAFISSTCLAHVNMYRCIIYKEMDDYTQSQIAIQWYFETSPFEMSTL